MSEHPRPFRLDAHVAGDLDPSVAAHIETCEACAAYVAATTTGAAEFAANEGKKSAEFVLALQDRPKARVFALHRLVWIAAPVLAAAAVLLVVRGRENPLVPVANEPAVRFKGGMQIAVVRDRSGDQSRILGEVHVRPGDRLRVEVAIDDAQPIEVGFLGKDGTWVPLLAPALIEAGTHFSERAARFDDTPTEGWILAGHPDAVNRAKTTRVFDDVRIMVVVVEP
jgi:hypothetical protein